MEYQKQASPIVLLEIAYRNGYPTQWLEDNGLKLEPNTHSQSFPDFTADIGGVKYDMEVKCWNYENPPAFDISNFDGFYREIFNNPAKLYAKYLIFAYKPTTHGFVIENIYLKNLWDITGKGGKYPVGLQVKQGRPFAIRPIPFHRSPKRAFGSIEEFVRAIFETRKIFELTGATEPNLWLKTVLEAISR